MYLILTPFIIIYIYELYRRKALSQNCVSDLWIISTWILVFSALHIPPIIGMLVWALLAGFLLLRWYCFFRFRLVLSLQLLGFLRQPRSFLDSLKDTHLLKICCIGLLLITTSLTGFLSSPSLPFWSAIWIASLFGSLKKTKTDTRKDPSFFSFPYEISMPISPRYPALRETIAFSGEKQIKIPLPPQKKPHIIFVFLESFRAKNIGCLGAKIPASPFFDGWAKQGLLFRNFHANGLQTFRAFISAYFGIPGHLPTVSLKPFCSLPLIGLPQILKKQGYHPAMIQSGALSFDHLHSFFHSHGFETILGFENIPVKEPSFNSWGLDDEAMLRYAAEWLHKQTSPTFLSLFTINNHHPWKGMKNWNFPVPKNLPKQYQNYLQTFSYTDHCLHIFLEQLKQKKLLDNSILFIAGDHGYEMGERGPISEISYGLFEENLHLPLLILADGITPKAYNQAASFIDFLPTVLDLLNIQAVHHGLGHSLLRKTSPLIYFSSPGKNPEIGCIKGRKKVICERDRILGFDLDIDPEEQINLGSDISFLEQKCRSFFQTIEPLFKTASWAPPPEKIPPFQLKAEKRMTDEEWLSRLHSFSPVPVVDLSHTVYLTDQALLKTIPNHAESWQKLSLANSSLFTDRSLTWIGNHCKNLKTLNLSHCHLMTDEGIKTVLRRCKEIRHLTLDGINDLTECIPENIAFNLYTCSLNDIPHLGSSSLIRLLNNSPCLLQWSCNLNQITDNDLLAISNTPKKCTHMSLSCGSKIHDKALNALLSAQTELQEVVLEDFPLIEIPDFSRLRLLHLKISDCPLLKDEAFDTLQTEQLICLNLKNCPGITEKGINKLSKNPNLTIFIDRPLKLV